MKTVTAEFTIVEGQEQALLEAAGELVAEVTAGEPETLLYLSATRQRSEDDHRPGFLVMIEAYADEVAFQSHLAPGSPWSRFAREAADHGWLVADASNPTGLKSTFQKLELRHNLARVGGPIGRIGADGPSRRSE